MKPLFGAIAFGALTLVAAAAWISTSPPEGAPEHFRAQLRLWRLQHPAYRWTEDADCKCEADLRRQRTVAAGIWKPNPDYRPYLAHGDFNGDGRADLAVGVKRASAASTYRILILSGQPGSKSFLSDEFGLSEVMFFGEPRPQPHRLLVGAFESQGGTFEPVKGGGYRFEGGDCC